MRLALLALTLVLASSASAFEDEAGESDWTARVVALKRSAEDGEAHAKFLLAGAYSLGHGGVPTDAKKAWRLRREAAEGGDPDAMLLVASNYRSGSWGDAKNPQAAERWYKKALAVSLPAAKGGDAAAMHRLARIYAYVFVDKTAAELWERKYADGLKVAAEKGDASAAFKLGSLYRDAGIAHNAPLALKWFLKAAEMGSVGGMYWYGRLISGGSGAPADPVASRAWLTKAAEAGSREAMNELGYRLAIGADGFPKERAEGVKWLERAVAAGDPSAYFSLATVSADPQEAVKWLLPLANSGDTSAQSRMSYARGQGEGVPQDKVEALKWLLIAKNEMPLWTGGDEDISRLESGLTKEEREQARQRAEAFEPAPLQAKPKEAATEPQAAVAKAAVPAPALPPKLPESPDDYALIVGIEHYRGLPSADYAENDARAMRERLISLGFPERNVVALIGEQATRSSLQAYLEEWLPKRVGDKSRVFFYFSGHGSPEIKTGRAYLVPSDGHPEFLKTTAYALEDLYAALGKLSAKQIVVALDSCFSGAGGRSVIPKGTRPLVSKVQQLPAASPRLVVLAAAEGDQVSGSLDDVKHGAFTYYLLEGLDGAAKDKSGAVTAGGLMDFVRPRVANAARRDNRDQAPLLNGDPGSVIVQFR